MESGLKHPVISVSLTVASQLCNLDPKRKERPMELTTPKKGTSMTKSTLDSIASRAKYLATRMIYEANHRPDKQKGDPKIGGHAAACASTLHIAGALHLLVKTGFDFIANKPHASPTDHAYNYLLDLFLDKNLAPLSLEQANTAMMGLRKFSTEGEPVFQSYHSIYDPDHHNFLPSGTVGIPPVNIGYLALAYRYAKEHGFDVPPAHFWAIAGDSEFREGSMFEAVPEFAERELGNLTWILDYNRQSLDGHRITNQQIMGASDADRIEKTFIANGWEVIQVRHGKKRLALFNKPGGESFKTFFETKLHDYELQALLLVQDMKALKKGLAEQEPSLKKFLTGISDQELYEGLRDFGGHDIEFLAEAMLATKKEKKRPSLIIVHTLKGWGLSSAAAPGNHNSLPEKEEVDRLQAEQGLNSDTHFARFAPSSAEGKFLQKRGQELLQQIKEQHALKDRNQNKFLKIFDDHGGIPSQIDINLKMASYPHTQWMLGQLNAKLNRCANTPLEESALPAGYKALTSQEKGWKTPAELMVAMAPDVGTSTNLNPLMDGKIFGAPIVKDTEASLGVKDSKLPDLVPSESPTDRFIRFEIAESNTMSCMGSFGRIRDVLGVPMLPLMTVYDFFIKRALDQLFYNLYWRSSFILVGTPSGVTLSPEGAQHGWKSDLQIPNQITWEPFYCVELDWILSDSIRRHMLGDNEGRTGVIIRCVTRGTEQKDMLKFLKQQLRFKQSQSQALCPSGYTLDGAVDEATVPAMPDEDILSQIRQEVLSGAYYLVDYRGYQNYEPGDNVVHIISMGSPTTEAVKASKSLLSKGIYANVIVITSSDLTCGNLAHENNYEYLIQNLGVNSHLYLKNIEARELPTLAGRRIPIVSVHDGEPGLLDNIGSIVGVRQVALAVRKHSKCGRPPEIYKFHEIDSDAVEAACLKVLDATASEQIELSPQ